MTLVEEVTNEAHEIFVNITAAVREGEITWEQGDELKKILFNDVADALNMQKVRELLYAWQ
jgi:hypothetical protein